jgi:uncharacterized membrane protein YjfL (UPF0719 family)
MIFDIVEHFKTYISFEDILDFISWEAIIYLVAVIILLWIGKKVNDWSTPYSIDEELTKKDNKALAVSFSGYLAAIAIIIVGVLTEVSPFGEPTEEGLTFMQRLRVVGFELLETAIWSLVGIGLLNLSRYLNDKLVLSRFDNIKEIVEDRNVGTGAVQFGTYVGTAFIVKAVIFGEVAHWAADLISTAVFFILAQLAFILFGVVYQAITRYDIHAEIERDNAAAGISFGLNLTAIGIILSGAIEKTDSLVIFLIWFIEGTILLLITRLLIDRIILPGDDLNAEIAKDKNWGAALIEGTAAVIVAFLLNASFA